MKRIYLGLIALSLMTTTSMAASHPTLDQLKQFIQDTSCSHSGGSITCTNNTDGSRTEQLPDIIKQLPDVVTKTQAPDIITTIVLPGGNEKSANHGDAYGPCGPWKFNPNGMKNKDGSAFCVNLDSAQITGHSGSPAATYRVITPGAVTTTVTPGGTETIPGGTQQVPTCTTSSATLSYGGGNPLNPNNYNLSSSGPTTSDGAC
jgi:hypothetical protein